MLYVFGWCKCHVLYKKSKFAQANFFRIVLGTTGNRIDNLCVPLVVLFPISYRRIPMRPYGNLVELGYFIEMTDYWSNFAKTILFENCSCFSKMPFSICVESPRIFQCLISIPAGFDWCCFYYFVRNSLVALLEALCARIFSFRFVHRSLSSANRRRSTSPIFLVSFTQPCDQQDRKIRTIRKSAAQWCGRRARGYRKSILPVNLLFVPNINM